MKIIALLLFTILLITVANSQKVNEIFSKAGGFKVSLLNESCSYPCVKTSSKMVNFDFVVPMGAECPKLKGSMELHEIEMESPCSQEVN